MPLQLILAAIAFLTFLNAIHHPFVHDDIIFIVQNVQIGHLGSLSELFFHPQNPAVSAGLNSYYRPLLELFYRLEYHFFGFNPICFHLINVLIHILNGLILFSILGALRFSKWINFGVSVLFLVHPVQSEAVACVSGFSNLACTFFVLLALQNYIRERLVLSFAFFILALFTKEQSIVMLPLVVLIDWYRHNEGRKVIWLAFALLTVFFLAIRQMVTSSHLLADILASPGEFCLRLLSIPNTIVMYLCLLIAPYDLHYYRNTDILANWRPGFMVLGLLGVAFTISLRKFVELRKDVLFGLGWFIICLFPVLNFVPLINEYSFILTAEHFLYLPMVGVVIVLAVILKRILSYQTLFGLSVLVCFYLMGLTICQNTFWQGQVPLFERMIVFENNFGRGHILLAKAYYAQKSYQKALDHYDRALEIMKGYELKASNSKAKSFYQRYIREIYSDMATILLEIKQYDKAIDVLNKQLVLDSRNVSLLNNIAVCYLAKGDKAQAEAFLKLALGLDSSYIPARDNLNNLLKSN